MNYRAKVGAERVINASGRMTRLGVNTLSEEVIAAMAEGARDYVDIERLGEQVGRVIADMLEADDAMVTSGAAAGVAIMVAATIAGVDLHRTHMLPETRDGRNIVLIQAGHQVQFGAPVNQMIRMAGGVPLAIGQVNSVTEAHLRGAISDEVVALLYVQSHHAVQKGMLSLQTCIDICSDFEIPVLVDAAAEEDLKKFTRSGATMVTFSGGKAIGGPTAGIIAGHSDFIRACRMQNRGIGRPMKVGKEQLLGLVTALEIYLNRDGEIERNRCSQLVDVLLSKFDRIDGLQSTRLADEAGRGIERAGIVLTRKHAEELVEFLVSGTPKIYPRAHLVNTGIVAFDPRPLRDGDVDLIVRRVAEFFKRHDPQMSDPEGF